MKKRRPWNSSRSSNPSTPPHNRELDSLPTKTKSFYDLKRRRVQRSSSKLEKKSANYSESPLKRDAFCSLESLFDLKKPLNLPEVYSLTVEYHQEGYVSSFRPEFLKNTKDLVKPLLPEQLEPHILERIHKIDDLKNEPEVVEEEPKIETPRVHEATDLESPIDEESSAMADNEEVPPEEPEAEPEAELEAETEDEVEAAEDEEAEDIMTELGGSQVIAGQPPSHPLPPGVGEGVSIKSGGRQESVLSSFPLTDTAVKEEMLKADERCKLLAKEIDQLKEEIVAITGKEELTEEDTQAMHTKQTQVMAKLAEYEKITRDLQRLLGLTDVSSATFAKMFDMLPYPHSKGSKFSPGDEKEIGGMDSILDVIRASDMRIDAAKGKRPEDLFDLPQIDYPEDKLPRVIVCGYTEDEIPKIVVADSKKKGKTLQNLTGKLTESLTMQEKLVLENAQLEGGKYKLEEALLEKDSAVESLQRKVCGLQAEMRIVVKENMELIRHVACLNQRITSPCCYPCPGGTQSAVSSPCPLRCASNTTTLQQDNDYCQCKCCLQSQFGDTLSPGSNNVCVNPDNYSGLPSGDSPRLAGGASRTGTCITSGASSQVDEMCCRSPATVKTPCPGPQQQRGVCPAELGNKLANYGNTSKQMEQQLGNIECEVRNIQIELANVQRERQQLEQQRKLLKCSGPCAPCGCCPPPPMNPNAQPYTPPASILPPTTTPLNKMPQMPPAPSSTCTGPCVNAPMGASTCPQQQLRDLREQYARLQDDYKNKLCEVSSLRTDAEKLKQQTREAVEEKEKLDIKLVDCQERLKILEAEKDKYEGFKEQMIEQEQALIVFKQRFREAQDELEELRSLIQDQASQLEDYRNKYLQAQQQVEEQRRQLDLMEMDNARMNENVTLEIGRVKNQFQEKLAELAPLPDILKQTQLKLQEAQQLRMVAERNCEELSRELIGCKDKMQTLQNQLDVIRSEYQAAQDERGTGTGRFDELERKNTELRHENERMKNTLARFEEHEAQLQKRIDDKMHEITQLAAMLEQVREDSARQVARTKERCETVRRSMQGQIAEMERQLAQCRATARAAQKDRDEIRQKMQGQINNLNEAFEQAQGRIRSLQGHVNYLKTSYSNIFKGQGEVPPGVLPGEAGTGFDTCDCNY